MFENPLQVADPLTNTMEKVFLSYSSTVVRICLWSRRPTRTKTLQKINENFVFRTAQSLLFAISLCVAALFFLFSPNNANSFRQESWSVAVAMHHSVPSHEPMRNDVKEIINT